MKKQKTDKPSAPTHLPRGEGTGGNAPIKHKGSHNTRIKQLFAAPFVVFLLIFVLLPLLLLIWNAFFGGGSFSFKSITDVFTDGQSMPVLWRSIWVAFIATAVCIAIGYPIAYWLALTKFNRAGTILVLFILPMWINAMLRIYALREVINIFTEDMNYGTLILGLVMDYLPFMIMPIYVVLSNIDKKLLEAASDLGAPPRQVFMKTVLPLSVPGILSGFLIVFTPSVSTYFISEYLGDSSKTLMFGELINKLMKNFEANIAKVSVLALILLAVLGLAILATNRLSKIGNNRGGLW